MASLAGKLRYAGLEETEILSALLEINSARCKPPLAPEEVADLAASIANRYPKGDFRVLWEQGGSDSWEDPQPLADSLPPVEPLNSNLLPSAIKPWVEDNSERMQCPIEYPAVGAIVALGALIGRQLSIRPKRFDHWTVVPNLWGAIIGRPGVMKTPAVAETLKPLQRLEVRAKEVFEEELKEAAAKEIYSEARQKDLKRQLVTMIKSGKLPEAKVLSRQVIDRKASRRFGGASSPTIQPSRSWANY